MLADEFDGNVEDVPFDPVLQNRLKLAAALGFLLDGAAEDPFAGYSQAIPLLINVQKATKSPRPITAIYDLVMIVPSYC